jgi:Spy/CpxP family protein refolding chaperone
MKKTAVSRGVALVCVSILAACTALAAGREEKAGGRAGLLRRALASLDLTQNQKSDIRALFEQAKPAIEDLRARVRSGRVELRAAAAATPADPAAVGKAFLSLRTDREALRGAFENLVSEIRAVLTPAQQSRFDGYLDALKRRRS